MDETTLRAMLDRATATEPPIGPLARNALRAGIRLRRRRRVTSAATSAAAVAVLAGGVPAITGAIGGPASGGHRPVKPTAYVITAGSTVVPVNPATGKAGKPIAVPPVGLSSFQMPVIAATPNGRTVYVLGGERYEMATPIDTQTNHAGPPINVHQQGSIWGIAITPNGKTAYVAGQPGGVVPVDIATNSALRPVKIPGHSSLSIAITPNSKTVYVADSEDGLGSTRTRYVTPVRVATNVALKPIKFSGGRFGFLDSVAISPDGRTAYVLDAVQGGKAYSNVVTPISTATNTALKPIRIKAPGFAEKVIVSPDGRTAYVLSSLAVTPIDTATNKAFPPISLPARVGDAYTMLMSPNGKTIYVLCPGGVIPVDLAARHAFEPIKIKGVDNSAVIGLTPDGTALYIGAMNGVVRVETATDAVGPYTALSARPKNGQPVGIVFTP
ncbi:MAG: hypothetical protein ACLQFR_22115 [Streptosporangiaceae bacterium]